MQMLQSQAKIDAEREVRMIGEMAHVENELARETERFLANFQHSCS